MSKEFLSESFAATQTRTRSYVWVLVAPLRLFTHALRLFGVSSTTNYERSKIVTLLCSPMIEIQVSIACRTLGRGESADHKPNE